MPQDKVRKARMRKGERRTLDGVVFMSAGLKDPKDGCAAFIVGDADGAGVIIQLQQESLSDFGMAALGVLHEAQQPQSTASRQTMVEVKSRLIPVSRLRVLDPQDAPAGHAVLELSVGEVALRFVAPAEMFARGLEVAAKSGALKRAIQ